MCPPREPSAPRASGASVGLCRRDVLGHWLLSSPPPFSRPRGLGVNIPTFRWRAGPPAAGVVWGPSTVTPSARDTPLPRGSPGARSSVLGSGSQPSPQNDTPAPRFSLSKRPGFEEFRAGSWARGPALTLHCLTQTRPHVLAVGGGRSGGWTPTAAFFQSGSESRGSCRECPSGVPCGRLRNPCSRDTTQAALGTLSTDAPRAQDSPARAGRSATIPHTEGPQSDSQAGAHPGCGSGPQLGLVREATDRHFSLPPFPAPFPSL